MRPSDGGDPRLRRAAHVQSAGRFAPRGQTQSMKRRRWLPALAVLLVVSLMAPLAFGSDGIRAQVSTDKPDYSPGQTVTISGDNSNFAAGEGYQEGETVNVVVDHDANDWTATCEATAAADGSWSCQVTLASAGSTAWGSYTYTATGQESGTTETGTFTDAPPATDLEQCRNGTAVSTADHERGDTVSVVQCSSGRSGRRGPRGRECGGPHS